MELKITLKMEKIINEKEKNVKKLNDLCKQLVALEIKERNKRAEIIENLTNSGEKLTDKVKTAKANKILKSELGKIDHLEEDINSLKRDINVLDDKLSLCRNMIRELQL